LDEGTSLRSESRAIERPITQWSLEVEESVGVVTYAGRHDALSLEAATELAHLLASMDGMRGEVTVIELRGSNEGFVPDVDREELARVVEGEAVEGDVFAWERIVSTLATLPQVSVAAVNGRTVGGGCLLAIACTFRVGSETLKFGPIDPELGVIGTNACPHLVRSLGPTLSTELLLTRRELDAESARRIGLFSAILSEAPFEAQAHEWCRRLAALPAATVFAVKGAVEAEANVSHSQFLAVQPPNAFIPNAS